MERPIGGYDNINGIGGNRAGILYAGNPFGAGFVIPKGRASGQPVMPGENPADINNVYGRPGPQPMSNPIQPRLPMAFGGSGAEPQVANAFTDWLFGKKSLSDIVAPGVDRTLKGTPDPTRINGSPGIRDTRNKQQQIIDQLRKGQSFVPEENTFLAQAFPGGQNIGNVGGMMQPPQEFTPMANFEGYGPPQPTGPSPEQLKALQVYDAAKQQKEAQNAAILQQGIQARNEMLEKSPTSSKPLYLDINAVPTGLESVGAGAKVDLGRNQNLNFGGMFTPGYAEQGVQIPQGYTLKAGYGTPSLDVNVNFREGRRGLGPQQGGGFGAEAMYNTRF